MKNIISRRKFIAIASRIPFFAPVGLSAAIIPNLQPDKIKRTGGPKLKISLNVYSFNQPLKKGRFNLADLLDFCAKAGFEAIDLTAYYFPDYPQIPTDEYLYKIKRKAFLLGLDISGTGVRNDFANPDPVKRNADKVLIKNWIEVAAKLGAPVLRIFAGKSIPTGYSWDQVNEWIVKDIKECVEYGRKFGVIIAIQNHNEFIKTADQVLTILEMVNSKWFGLVLDIGSFRSSDPYKEIARIAPFAVNWQIKEYVYINGKPVKTDLKKIITILRNVNYRGYIPIETLGPGDPLVKVPQFLSEVKDALK